MDNHKMLYKEQRSFTSSQRSKTNRELMKARRIQQRREGYQDSRNILPSPIEPKKELTFLINSCDNKENITNRTTTENTNTTRLAKIICNTTNPEKLTKQESYVKRFLEWKEKNRMKKEVTNKKKPFLSAVSSNTHTSTHSFVPSGHPEGFRPPEGLKKTVDQKNEKEKRQSIYSVVPTPPRPVGKSENKFPIARKAVATSSTKPATDKNSKTKTQAVNKKPIIKKSPTKTEAKGAAVNLKNTLENKKQQTNKTATVAQPLLRNYTKLRARTSKMSPKANSLRSAVTSTNRQTGAVAKVLRVAQKRTEMDKQNKSPLEKSRAGLAQNLKAKKVNAIKNVNVPSVQINGKKLINLFNKSKLDEDMVIQTPTDFFSLNPFKELVTSTRIKHSIDNSKNVDGISPTKTSERLHSNSSSKRNIFQEKDTTLCNERDNKPQEKTKEDGIKNLSKKFNFIRYSNVSDETFICQKDNGVEKQEGEEKIKNLSNDSNKTVQVLEANEITPVKSGPEERPINYLSPYVIVARGKVSLKKEEQKRNSVYLQNAESIDVLTSPNYSVVANEITPVKSGPEERPVNYLSPYVSVARGKVSLKKEEQKRNSVYLQNAAESIDVLTSPTYSVEVHRTIEGVRYFRKQLQDEIDRLHKLCDIWEAYKTDNLETIQNANGEDMIDVTIGQTRLLTSKKFMQFKGLIDRCESGATGIGKVAYDGGEDTKPITLVDLEGFWSMLGLQVDNLDKRFDNLNRWKLNDWKDPDEVDTKKIKKNLTKVKKTKPTVSKAKPSLALQSMLRKMQAEMRKNKNSVNEEVQTESKLKRRSSISNKGTPRKSIETSTTGRLFTVVKDRKYFSPKATVISVSFPNSGSSRKQRKSLQDSPKLDRMQSPLSLRKSVLINDKSRLKSLNSPSPKTNKNSSDSTNDNNKENEVSVSNYTNSSSQSPPQSTLCSGRKSILKTPGTAKSKIRNVIFNEKVRAKKFNFLFNEDGTPFNEENREDANQTHEEDLAKSCDEELESTDASQRTYKLRSRKVHLRPSSEIVIPKK